MIAGSLHNLGEAKSAFKPKIFVAQRDNKQHPSNDEIRRMDVTNVEVMCPFYPEQILRLCSGKSYIVPSFLLPHT